MRENLKKWRKKHPQKHRRYGEKRNRDYKKISQQNVDFFYSLIIPNSINLLMKSFLLHSQASLSPFSLYK